MKSDRKELWFNVLSRRAFINITPQAENCLKESGVREGLMPVKDNAYLVYQAKVIPFKLEGEIVNKRFWTKKALQKGENKLL